jgi:4-diphosphocytidyl-2-C-methyl-D-erythritol kinase
MARVRRARVRALAKVNLDLRVLGKRPDRYHELRTVFQTISLADEIELAFEPRRSTEITLAGAPGISDNLVLKAAGVCFEELRLTGRLEMSLSKRIPIGAGLGGGSSDAAAVLLALPVLAGGVIRVERLTAMARDLGSDVPFFLLGGRAAGLGRGTELYPLPDAPAGPALLIAPPIHVSTASAYRGLNRGELTTEPLQNKIDSFQSQVWDAGAVVGVNDFEDVVFREHPSLRILKQRLVKLGAHSALMSGSGSSVYGIFDVGTKVDRAIKSLRKENVFPISLVSRARYRASWFRWLGAHRIQSEWPPQSRYAR